MITTLYWHKKSDWKSAIAVLTDSHEGRRNDTSQQSFVNNHLLHPLPTCKRAPKILRTISYLQYYIRKDTIFCFEPLRNNSKQPLQLKNSHFPHASNTSYANRFRSTRVHESCFTNSLIGSILQWSLAWKGERKKPTTKNHRGLQKTI